MNIVERFNGYAQDLKEEVQSKITDTPVEALQAYENIKRGALNSLKEIKGRKLSPDEKAAIQLFRNEANATSNQISDRVRDSAKKIDELARQFNLT